ADHRPVRARHRIQPADHGGAATKWNDGDSLLGAVTKDLQDLLLIGRGDDQIWGRDLLICAPIQQVEIAFPARAGQALVGVVGNEGFPNDGGETFAVGVGDLRGGEANGARFPARHGWGHPSIFSSIFWMDGDSGLASSWVPQRLNSMGGVGSD